jgi:hypothetical protein
MLLLLVQSHKATLSVFQVYWREFHEKWLRFLQSGCQWSVAWADGTQSGIAIERPWVYFENGVPKSLYGAMGVDKNARTHLMLLFH